MRKPCENLDESQQDKAEAFPGCGVASHKCWCIETYHVGQGCQGPLGRWLGRGGCEYHTLPASLLAEHTQDDTSGIKIWLVTPRAGPMGVFFPSTSDVLA